MQIWYILLYILSKGSTNTVIKKIKDFWELFHGSCFKGPLYNHLFFLPFWIISYWTCDIHLEYWKNAGILLRITVVPAPVFAALQKERMMGKSVWRWRLSERASLKVLAAATGLPSRQRRDELCAASKPINLRSKTIELSYWAVSIST